MTEAARRLFWEEIGLLSKRLMFIDSHAHLFFKDFQNDLDGVLQRAGDAGVERIVCPGTDLETSRKSVELAERFDMVYAAVGFHPHDAKKAIDEKGAMRASVLEDIERLSTHAKVVAIGEIGLDYHYNYSPPDVQCLVFSEQIRLARKRKLPIIIHTREAESDVLRIVREEVGSGWEGPEKGVFHCFSGDVAMARKVIDWGFYISIPGPVTFPPKPGKLNTMAQVVAGIPAEHILLETDSPFLTPHPFRGKRNEPSYLPIIAKKISELKECSVDEVGLKSTTGTNRLFHIDKGLRQ